MKTVQRGVFGVVCIGLAVASARGANRNVDVAAEERAEVAANRKAVGFRALEGPTGEITRIALSTGGRMLATSSTDGVVRLWDVASGKVTHTLEAHHGPVDSLAWSPNGKWVVSGGRDKQVIVWDAATGEIKALHQQPCPAENVAFLPDSEYFVSTCGVHVRLWKLGEPAQVMAMESKGEIVTMAIMKDGAVVTADLKNLMLWDTSTGAAMAQKTYSGGPERRWIRCLVPLKSGHVLVAAAGGTFEWDAQKNEMRYVMSRSDYGMMLTPDEKMLLMPGGHGVVVSKSGSEPNCLINWIEPPPGGLGRYGEVREAAMSDDGRLLAMHIRQAQPNSEDGPPVETLEVVETKNLLKLFEDAERQGKLRTVQRSGAHGSPPAPWQ